MHFQFVIALSSIMLSTTVTGFPLSQFYPFGSAVGDIILPSNDDESTPSIYVSVPFPFFGSSYSSIYVNNNGYVTFDPALKQFIAQAFPINGSHKMIAAFWTDIDTDPGGSLWYRTTTDSTTLQNGTNTVRTVFPSFGTFSATWMMIVTWNDVAAYDCSDTGAINCQQRNTFQLVLISNEVHSFAVFMYNVINWTNKAEAGYNAGDGIHYYSVPGSMTESMLNLPQASNVGVPGQFVFMVDKKTTDVIPQILTFESNSSVLREGKSAWLNLDLRGNTMYEVQWFHSGYLISNSTRRYKLTSFETQTNTSLHTLQINDVLKRDEGEWKIIVKNSVMDISSHLNLTVIPRLLLIMTPQYDFSIMMGEKINLQCTVSNPESLRDAANGSLVMTKDGTVLSGLISSNLSTTWTKTTAMEDDTGRYTCTHSSYQDPMYVSVNVTVFKPEQNRCESEWSDGILWNITLANTTKEEPCPSKQKGMATRYCTQLGVWESPSFIKCTTEAFIIALSQIDEIIEDGLDGLENTEKVQEVINDTLKLMKNLTSSTFELSAGDLSASLDVLDKIVNVTNSTGSAIEKEVFYAVIDNVLSTNNTKSWAAVSEKTDKDASSILKNMDRISEIVIQSGNITASQFSGLNFELTVNKTNLDENGICFPDVSPCNKTKIKEQNPTFLELPKQNMEAESAINYVAVVYKTMSDILPSASDSGQNGGNSVQKSKTATFVNSQILSLTTQKDLGELDPNLTLTFRHITNNEFTKIEASCVSWDFTISKWTKEGCYVIQSGQNKTVCQCSHLTNFAILMRPYFPVTEDQPLLKTMSLVGVILSISFTAFTFIIYIMTWRYIKSDQNIIMMNLCGSLILSYVIFISAVEQKSNEAACIAITSVIHYLFLVTFFSMLGMGVYYFMSITVTYYAMYVANNFKSKSRVQWFLLAIWGVPFLITTTTLGAFWGEGYHLESYCWLSIESGSLYMFIIPVCLICVLNILIIVSLVRVLCASSAMMKSSLQKKATSGLRSLGTLLPVLGVTWLFGILAVNENADVFQYIFVIANSLQGFFIFVSHVLLNKKVIQGLRNRYPVISSLKSKAEHGKPEADSASQSQSTSKSNSALVTTKKKSIFQRILDSKEENLDLTERTISTDIHSSVTHEKNSAVPENKSTNLTVTLLAEENRGFRFSFILNLWQKRSVQ
ncbi:adhesion G protein-coupled receptor B1-like isoform X2 [Crassostrea angulata]|nr:adhesion G protein-coupled receptor B1-like isoform X2 [Crassostrea angulata]